MPVWELRRAPWVLGLEYYLHFNGVDAIKLAISCPYLSDSLMAQTLSAVVMVVMRCELGHVRNRSISCLLVVFLWTGSVI